MKKKLSLAAKRIAQQKADYEAAQKVRDLPPAAPNDHSAKS